MTHADSFPKRTVETTFHVRYAETDQMGIVHHASYAVWLEEGRSHWMRANGNSYSKFEAEGLVLAVSELHLRYKQSARYDQLVTVRCWIAEVRSRQMQFGYQVLDAVTASLFAEGYSKHVCLNKAGKVTKIPEQWRQLLEQALVS